VSERRLDHHTHGQEITAMANVKKGLLTVSGVWWRHLRRMKRLFWKRERRAAKREALHEVTK
jgi:hypothetical protein